MKVKKKRNGYTLTLTNGDYALLEHALGSMNPKPLSGDAKRAFTVRSKAHGAHNLLAVDTDTRTAPIRAGSFGG